MKIYTPPPPIKVLRVSIRKQGYKTEHLTFEHVSPEEARDTLQFLIQDQQLSIFERGKVTAVDIREYDGKQNGRTISFSFRGLNPDEVKELFLANFA